MLADARRTERRHWLKRNPQIDNIQIYVKMTHFFASPWQRRRPPRQRRRRRKARQTWRNHVFDRTCVFYPERTVSFQLNPSKLMNSKLSSIHWEGVVVETSIRTVSWYLTEEKCRFVETFDGSSCKNSGTTRDQLKQDLINTMTKANLVFKTAQERR